MNAHLLSRFDELREELCDNSERMVNVARLQRVSTRKSQLLSIMFWTQKAAKLINDRLNNGNGNGNGNGRKSHL